MKNYLYILFFLTNQVIAQNVVLKGTIVDAESSLPIEDVNVILKENNRHSHTNNRGEYSISDLNEGFYEVEFVKLGFVTRQISIEIKKDEVKMLNLALQKVSFELQSVEIGSSRPVSAASYELLNQLDFENRPRNSAQDLLRVVPGLFIAQHAGGGKAEQIFVRGFDCDHGTDVATFVDGIPVNMPSHGHGQGYADLHFLIPETIQQIEVLKGPYSPRFGNFATGAAVSFNTLDSLPNNLIQLESAFTSEINEFTASRQLLMVQLPLNATNVSSYFAADIVNNRSYFEADQKFKRFSVFSKTSVAISSYSHLHLSFGGFGSSWNASGQIPERAVQNNNISRFGSIVDNEGGTTQRNNFSIVYHTKLELSDFEVQYYMSDYRFRLYSNFTFFLDDAINGDEIEQNDDRKVNGINMTYSVGHKFLDLDNKFSVGVNFRSDKIANQLWHTKERSRMKAVAMADIFERSTGVFISELFRLGDKFRIEIGTRFDYFIFDVEDLLPSDSTYNNYSGYNYQNLISPKLNISYSASKKVQLFVNTGSGFHSNDARSVVRDPSNHRLPKAIGLEFGAITTFSNRLIVTAALWGMDVENELVYIGDAGTTEDKGSSRRIGVDFSARIHLTNWLFGDLDLNYSRNYFTNELFGDKLSNDFYLPLAPTFTSVGGISARIKNHIETSIRFRHLAERPANESNTVVTRPFTILDYTVNYTYKKLKVGLIIENLLNSEWNEAQFNTESRLFDEVSSVEEIHFTPGTPFAARITMGYTF